MCTSHWCWCFFLCASFLIWRDQRQAVAELEQQLKNPITITFEWSNSRPFLEYEVSGKLWVRARAINGSNADVTCRVFMNSFEKVGETIPILSPGDSIELLWAGGEYGSNNEAAGDRVVPAGLGRIVNLAYIAQGANELSIQPEQFARQVSEKLSPGTYKYTIQASHSTCRSDPTIVSVKYEGQQQVSFAEGK
jgi:hypothetical protein